MVLLRLRSGLSTHLCGLSFECLAAYVPTIAPDQLCLDRFEECLNHRIEAPIFVKLRFELI